MLPLQLNASLRKQCESQQALLGPLIKDRQEKQMLEQQMAGLKEELRRVHIQKERLEGLCRALQASGLFVYQCGQALSATCIQ